METEAARELERVQKENFTLKLRVFSLEQELHPDRSTGKEAAFASEISTEIEKRDQLLLKAKLSIQSLSSENDTLRHRLQSVETLLSETETQALEWKQRVSAFDAESILKGKQAESAQNNFKLACQQIEEQKQKIKQQHYLILQLQNKLNPSAAVPSAPQMGAAGTAGLTQDESECLLEDIGVQWRRYVSSIEAKHAEELDAIKKGHQQQLERFFQGKNSEIETFQKDYAQLQETIFGLRNQNADMHRAIEDMKLQEDQFRQTAEHFKNDSMEKAGQIQQLKLALGEAEDIKMHAQSLQAANSSLADQVSDLTGRIEVLIREASDRVNEISSLRSEKVTLEARAKQADALEKTLETRSTEISELRRDNIKYQEDNKTLFLEVEHLRMVANFVPEKEETIRKQLEMITELQNINVQNSYEINSLKDTVAGLTAKEITIATLTKQLETADAELKRRQMDSVELTNLRSTNDQVVLELTRLKADHANTIRELREIREAHDTLKALHSQVTMEADARSSELTAELATYKAQASQLKAKISDLELQGSSLKAELDTALAHLESRAKDIEFVKTEKCSSERILTEYRENLKKQEQEFEAMMTEQNERIATLGKELDSISITFRSACKAVEDMSVRLRISKITNVKTLEDILSITSAVIRRHEGVLAELDASNTRTYEIQLKADQTRSELARVKKELDYCNGEIEGKDKRTREYLAEIDTLNRSIEGMRQEVSVAEKNLKEALDQRSKLKTYNNEYKDKIARQELRITSLQEKIKSQEVLVAERVKEIELSMQRQVKTFLDAMTDHISRRVSPEIALSEIKRFELIFLSTEDALNRQLVRVNEQFNTPGDILNDPFLGHNMGQGVLMSSNVRPVL